MKRTFIVLKLFSVDDHIVEPAHVWSSRLPQKFQEAGPHVVEADGRQFWVYEDQKSATMGSERRRGQGPHPMGHGPVRFADLIPGCYEAAARADDFRADGIVGSVLFPSLPGFGGRVFHQMKDKELGDLCVKAYNDFMIDEWCTAAPEIFVPTIICQLWDPELAAAEIRRCAAKGARALSFPENPSYLKLPSLHQGYWDPVFDALEETEVVCSMHLGSSGHIPIPTPDSHFSVAISAAPASVAIESLSDLLFGTLPRRFPNVQFVMTEGGIGYVPYLLERCDFVWGKHRYWAPFGDMLPSDIFHRQFSVCAVNESFGLSQESIEIIGIDNVLWESDYPHSETTWPASQTEAAKSFSRLTPEQIDKISHKNAERIFRFPVTPGTTFPKLDRAARVARRAELEPVDAQFDATEKGAANASSFVGA